MPPRRASVQLKVGDVVLVLALCCGLEWAQETYASTWRTAKVEGTITGRAGSKWTVGFEEDGFSVNLNRGDITFKSRPEQDSAAGPSGSSGRARTSREQVPDGADEVDSSDEEDAAEEPEDEIPRDDDGEAPEEVDGWTEDNHVSMGQRALRTSNRNQPVYNLPDYESKELWDYALHCLPMEEITAMAALMEANGLARLRDGQRNYMNWKVTSMAVLKWFGCWMYMLAFPMEGARSVYFRVPDFGPTHSLTKFGVTEFWFQNMMACFEIPVYEGQDHGADPFRSVRRWWNAVRDAIQKAMEPGYVLVLDESMFRWLGRHMPGLMVVRRKPTPIGGEVHTMCCGISGAFVNLELWEGAAAMATKKFCNTQTLKSVALTLRLVEPWKSTGRVLIADSWFGSVPCILVLFAWGLYGCMNVKTAHKGYPKEQLLAKLGYDKKTGLCDKARRGEHCGYSQTFSTNAGECKVVAGALNQKKPLLLVDTASSLLPADDRVKHWTVVNAQGEEQTKKTTQKMTMMHELYHDYYGVVDQGNRDRQGQVSIADVWETTKWQHRHFAEGLGFWEVTVFKHATFFHPRYKKTTDGATQLSHQRFRVLLAYTLLTGGQCLDNPSPEGHLPGTSALGAGTSTAIIVSPGQGAKRHQFTVFPGHKKHQCAYCPCRAAYTFCKTCTDEGQPCLALCSFTTGRDCQDKHRRGYPPKHGNAVKPASAATAAPKKRNRRGEVNFSSPRRSTRPNFGSPGQSGSQ